LFTLVILLVSMCQAVPEHLLTIWLRLVASAMPLLF